MIDFSHLAGWLCVLVAVQLIASVLAASALVRVALPMETAFASQGAYFALLAYRVLLVLAVLSTFNAVWRLTHHWWLGPAGPLMAVVVMPRTHAAGHLARLRAGEFQLVSFMQRRWMWCMAALVLLNIADVFGSVDYRPFG